jgi:hypothetical protein
MPTVAPIDGKVSTDTIVQWFPFHAKANMGVPAERFD